VPHKKTPIGPGDDAAVLAAKERVLSADALIEGVHFLKSHPPEWLGWKTLAVNFSDVNAMGATAEAFAFTAAIPANTPPWWWTRFAAGMGAYAKLTGTHLVGGDIVRSPGPICLSVTAWGDYDGGPLLTRDQACDGDILMVVGSVGASGCGLKEWRKIAGDEYWQSPLPSFSGDLMAHLKPTPPLWAGPKALALGARVGIDLSDGLVTDLGHIARASKAELVVDVDRLPLSPESQHIDVADVVGLGEDYSLLVSAPSRLTHEFEALGFVSIGRVGVGDVSVRFQRDQQPLELRTAPFEHFEN